MSFTKLFLKKNTNQPAQPVMWHEAGSQLPVKPQERQPLTAPSVLPLAVPSAPGVSVDDAVRVALVDTLKCPLQHFKIIESIGRVVLVIYQPHNHYDPILPFPLIDLGEGFKTEFRAMALELSKWVSDMFALVKKHEEHARYTGYLHRQPPAPRPVSATLYYDIASHHMERVLRIAYQSGFMTAEEWQYFNFQLRLSIAKPDRFTHYDNEEWKTEWKKAITINNNRGV